MKKKPAKTVPKPPTPRGLLELSYSYVIPPSSKRIISLKIWKYKNFVSAWIFSKTQKSMFEITGCAKIRTIVINWTIPRD